MKSCHCFQLLMTAAEKTALPSSAAGKKFAKNKRLPNVHAGLHLSEFANEYGTVMACNVLAGETKHK